MNIRYFTFHKSDLTNLTVRERWFVGFFVVTSLIFWPFLLVVMLFASKSASVLAALVFFGILWVVYFALTLIFFQRRTAYFIYAFLILLVFSIFGARGLNFIGVLGFSICLWQAYKVAQSEKSLLLEFKPLRIARRSLPWFFVGFSVILAFAYNSIIISDSLQEPRVSKTFFSIAYAPADLFLRLSVPGYTSQTTIAELQGTFIENILPNILPETILNSTTSNRLFSMQFSDPVISAQTPKDFTFSWLNQNISGIIAPYRTLLPAFFVIGLFFAFRFFLFIGMWVVLALLWLVMKIFLWYSILLVQKIKIQKEEVFLK